MEVGDLKMKGTIDIVSLENGLNQIMFDLKKVDATSASVNSDFERMNQQASRLAVGLGLIGASAALLNLGKHSPQLSADLASIGNSMFLLGMSVGTALKPAFDWFADKLNWLANWASTNPNLFGGIVQGVTYLGLAFAAFKIGTAFVGFMACAPTLLAIGAAIYVIIKAYQAFADLLGGKKKTAEDIGRLVGTIGGGIAGGIAGAAVGNPVLGVVIGAAAGGALGDLLGKGIGNIINPGSQGYYGSSSSSISVSSPSLQSRQGMTSADLGLTSAKALSLLSKYQSRQNVFLGYTDLTGR